MPVPIGTTGTITVATKGQDGPGEVELDLPNANAAYLAYSTEPIRKGAMVVVYANARGGRAVDVEVLSP